MDMYMENCKRSLKRIICEIEENNSFFFFFFFFFFFIVAVGRLAAMASTSFSGYDEKDAGEVLSWLPWCLSLPKIELHAHLNGSIRPSTLLDLAQVLSNKGLINLHDVQRIILKGDRSLAECFKLFDLIHMLTTDHGTIIRITKEVIEDFVAENVVYLELRTTPKCNLSLGMTKRSYVEAVINGFKAVETAKVIFETRRDGEVMEKFEHDHESGVDLKSTIHVKLLLSIDRRESTQSAIETVQLALAMREYGVVGVDLSGNPRVGNWQTYLPALLMARKHGLPITLHCGEVPNPGEIRNMLDFHPERIGHACCLEEVEWLSLLQTSIPVEVCLTSNVRTESIPVIRDHHFVSLYNSRHPLILCTDDPGVFGSHISQEYAIAAVCFGLSKSEVLSLARDAIDHIFASNDVKTRVLDLFEVAEKKLDMS